MEIDEYSYIISGNAHYLYPAETHFGLFGLNNGSTIDIPQQFPFSASWGETVVDNVTMRDILPLPESFHLAYLSIVERKFYSLLIDINPNELNAFFSRFTGKGITRLVVGMAPYGGTSLWLGNDKKQILLGWLIADETAIDMVDFLPEQSGMSLDDVCDFYINNDEAVRENLEVNGLPARDLFDRYMQQFCYRYLVMFEHWDEDEEQWVKPELDEDGQPVDGKPMPEFDFIEEALWDGTHDKLHDGGLMSYHMAGKPKKLALEWHIKKSQYTAYLWFDDELIRTAFEKFYGAHRDTKVDFIIRIDPEKNKYELALYRYGLQEPVVITENAYQMMVFKSKFEYYRSENYDQPRGAWIW